MVFASVETTTTSSVKAPKQDVIFPNIKHLKRTNGPQHYNKTNQNLTYVQTSASRAQTEKQNLLCNVKVD